MGHHMVDMIPAYDGSDPSERFASSGRQIVPLTGYRDLEPNDILGTKSSKILRVPLKILTPHDTQDDVDPVAESPMTPALLRSDITTPPYGPTPDPREETPLERLCRLGYHQGKHFLCLWNTVTSDIRRIDFALDAAGWDPSAIDALCAILSEYADMFSSNLDNGCACSLRPLQNKAFPETLSIQ